MSFTRKVKFPLTNHVDIAGAIAHSNLFEAEYSRVGLTIGDDDFGASTQQDLKTGGDGAKSYGWNILNSANADAVDVNITNAGYLTIDCNAASTGWIDADFSGVYVYKNEPGDFSIETLLAGNETTNYHRSGIIARDPAASAGEDWVAIHQTYNSGNKIAGWNTVNSVTAGTGDDIVSAAKYLKMTRVGNVFTTYYKVNIGDNWTQKRQDIRADFASTIQVGLASATFNTLNTYIAKFDYARGFGYPTTSPSPATAWTALQAGDVVDMSTAKVWMYKDGVVQAAGNTDVTFKYAANGGSDSTAKTLTQLRAESDVTVTNETNSFKIYGLYASDGLYKSESETWIEFNVVSVDGGNIFCLID